MIAEDSLRDDSSSASFRKLQVRADHFEEDLAALEAALAGTASAAAAASAEQPADFAELTLRGWGRLGRWPPPPTDDPQNHRIAFGRFVDLLAQTTQTPYPGRGAATIRTFKIVESDFPSFYKPNDHYREEDLERLFRDVLPNHPTIDRIQLGECVLRPRYVRLLVSSVPSTRATPLLELTLKPDWWESACVQDVCDMLRRDVPLRALTLVSCLVFDGRRIFESLADNTHLEGLAICFGEARADAFCLKAPALRVLHLRGEFTTEGADALGRELTTNTTLVELRVMVLSGYSGVCRALEHALQRHNTTIRSLWAGYHEDYGPVRGPVEGKNIPTSTIPRSLRRNRALHRLLQCRGAAKGLWPRLLECLNGHPSLVYKVLKRGDTNDLFKHLLAQSEAKTNGVGGGPKKKKIRTA